MDPIVSVSYDFKNESEARDFIMSCEEKFFGQVDLAADRVLASGKKFIALSGPTCSGKTTASDRICSEIVSRGYRVKVISVDDFYLSRRVLEERAKANGTHIDFDSPTTIDNDYLAECVDRLREGKVAELPHYGFVSGEREGYTSFDGKDADFYLVEGIQAIYPSVLDILHRDQVVSLFIRPSTSLAAGSEIFESHEQRFARRLVRDFRDRGAPPEYTFYLWEGVRQNEKIHIEPYEHTVDFRIDSTMAYEPCVIRSRYISYLEKVPHDSPYRAKAELFIKEYDSIPSISSTLVPDHSIFREFVGKRQ